MIRCRELLRSNSHEGLADLAARERLECVLMLHAASAVVANGATVVHLVTIMLVNLLHSENAALWFVVMKGVDDICNITCALWLSGVLAALRDARRSKSLPTRVESDVIGSLARAAGAAEVSPSVIGGTVELGSSRPTVV
jgi:hypothetical protein